MSRLLLVRHGITVSNSAHRFAGHSDVELSALGYRQAERLRDRLRGDRIDAVYSSDLRRALVTAEIISSEHKVAVETCPELREIDYGEVEGLTFDEIGRLYPKVMAALTSSSRELKFPGGESLKNIFRRVGRFLIRLEKHTPAQTILIAAHRGPLRVLVCRLLGLGPGHWRQIGINNASLSVVETNSLPRAVIKLLNDTSHLTGVEESD